MTSSIPQLRRMTAADLDFADHLRALVGWNQTKADWLRFLAAEPEGCFVADLDGAPVGTATTIRYGSDLAWIGMVLVLPEHRKQGVGRALLRHCLQFLRNSGVSRIRLDATPQGRPVYEALGFRPEFDLNRWEGSTGSLARDNAASNFDGLRSWQSGDAERVEALDRRAFGASRRPFLESLGNPKFLSELHADEEPGRDCPVAARQGPPELEMGQIRWPSSRCDEVFGVRKSLGSTSTAGLVATSREGEVEGYGLIRPGARARYLGPVVARSEETGLRLVRSLLEASGSEPVFWDVPDFQEGAVRWAEAIGFRKQRVLTRMVLGPEDAVGSTEPHWLWAISGPETG
jgi:GNAT superfamily N-acetyltransferase